MIFSNQAGRDTTIGSTSSVEGAARTSQRFVQKHDPGSSSKFPEIVGGFTQRCVCVELTVLSFVSIIKRCSLKCGRIQAIMDLEATTMRVLLDCLRAVFRHGTE